MNNAIRKEFDLEERTARFGENVVKLCRSIRLDSISKPIVNQLIRSAQSIGANYAEANNASSRKDFRNKIYIVKKECQETKHTIRILAAAVAEKTSDLRVLWKECHELTLIFQKIASSLEHK